jgi:hypothetical protein
MVKQFSLIHSVFTNHYARQYIRTTDARFAADCVVDRYRLELLTVNRRFAELKCFDSIYRLIDIIRKYRGCESVFHVVGSK